MKLVCSKPQLVDIINTVQRAIAPKTSLPILECIKIDANGDGNVVFTGNNIDICIEYNNRAAFVTECKFWKGKQVLNSTLKQLLSYTTWHDSKLAIVFFSKTNKDFFKVIETIEDNLKLLPKFKSLTDINKNEIELFLSSDNQGQLLKIRIFVFNLYTKINKEEKI